LTEENREILARGKEAREMKSWRLKNNSWKILRQKNDSRRKKGKQEDLEIKERLQENFD
jgi:hypothetical protein